MTEAPWLLAPAAAIVLTVLAIQLVTAASQARSNRRTDRCARHNKSGNGVPRRHSRQHAPNQPSDPGRLP